jgi:carbonic anhydrase/acetyltransferase-like protein (isoleucine patch superfamily)
VVTGDAEVACRSQITGYAQVYDHALVTGQSIIRDYAIVSGNARIINSLVGGHSRVYQNAVLYTELDAYYKVEVSGYTRIYGTAFLRSGAKVTGNARISGCVVLEKATLATENAVVYGSDVIGDEEKPVVITNAGYVTSCPEKQSKNDCFEEPAMDHCQ